MSSDSVRALVISSVTLGLALPVAAESDWQLLWQHDLGG
jgi:hypothetical protein